MDANRRPSRWYSSRRRGSDHRGEPALEPCDLPRRRRLGTPIEGLGRPLRVAVLEEQQTGAPDFEPWSELGSHAQIVFYSEHLSDPHALVRRLSEFNVIVTTGSQTVFSRSLLTCLPRLRLLINMTSATEHIDLDATRELGVTVSSAGARNLTPPDMAWSLLLALRRHVAEEQQDIQQDFCQVGELHGDTLGMIGLERQGALLASIGRAFGMRVLAWNEHCDPEMIGAVAAQPVGLSRLLSDSDVVMVNLQADDHTSGLISTAELRLLKPTAYLINTCDAATIDAHALIDALHAGLLAGAGLEVSDIEPLAPAHPLRKAPRTLLMSEGGYASATSYRPFYTRAVQNIIAFMEGEPLRALNH
ncbi:MAG: NAD(P)-dependent oxidoreductase [Solirubrobacteraceae bacterium]